MGEEEKEMKVGENMGNKNEGNKTRKEDRKEELKEIVARVREKVENDFVEQERKSQQVIDFVYNEMLENVVYNICYGRARGFTDGNINIVLCQSVVDKFEIDESEITHYERFIGLEIVRELEEIFNDVKINFQEFFDLAANRHDRQVHWKVK